MCAKCVQNCAKTKQKCTKKDLKKSCAKTKISTTVNKLALSVSATSEPFLSLATGRWRSSRLRDWLQKVAGAEFSQKIQQFHKRNFRFRS